MSSTNGSEPVEQVSRPRRPTPTSTDPAVLAAEIERTREDLAETLDAIADRVSPKRVADRTRKQVADAVATAKVVVAEQAGVARAKATEQAGVARAKATELASGAKEKVAGVSGARAGGGSVALTATSSSAAAPSTSSAPVAGTSGSALPPVTAVQADGLDLSLPRTSSTPTPSSPLDAPPSPFSAGTPPKPELVAGGALGLLVLLLLRRRRKRRKALRRGAVAALAGAGVEMRNDFQKARQKGRAKR